MEDVIAEAQSLTDKYVVAPKVLEKQQIRIDVNNPDGFSFSLHLDGSEYVLVFGDWHQPFGKQEEALLAFAKCLSGEAQLRIVTSLNVPYRATLEILDSDAQRPQVRYVMGSVLGLLLFPFHKKERVYRNSFTRAS